MASSAGGTVVGVDAGVTATCAVGVAETVGRGVTHSAGRGGSTGVMLSVPTQPSKGEIWHGPSAIA